MMDSSGSSSLIGLATVQMQPGIDRESNLQLALDLIEDAAGLGASVVVLPELFSIPFVGPDIDQGYFDWAEPLNGPSNEMVQDCSERKSITVISSIFEESTISGVYHNTVCIFSSGELRSVYRKSHLPFSNGFPEKYYFRPGEEPPAVVDIGPARIGVMVCYERHFPELSRLAALGGSSILCLPVACASAATKSIFELELRAHAVFNGMYVVCANRVGPEGDKHYYGLSGLYGPDGEVLGLASEGGPGVVFSEVDLDLVRECRKRLPFLRDRRPDIYKGLWKSDKSVERGKWNLTL